MAVARTPGGPASTLTIQRSQAAAAYMGKARAPLRMSIQGPGRGRRAARPEVTRPGAAARVA